MTTTTSALLLVVAVATGIPDHQTGILDELLTEARRLSVGGMAADDMRKAILQLNSNLPEPLPTFSAGGLADCIAAVLARWPGGAA